MSVRIGVNGLGRIGRCILRALAEDDRGDIELVAVNGPAPRETHLQLLKYDSIHGRFRGTLALEEEMLVVGRHHAVLSHARAIKEIDWGRHGVDVVLECTGAFTSRAEAACHLARGVKKVVISAPAKEADVKTIVFGVNEATLGAEDDIISAGSCTTNALAPVAQALHRAFGIASGFMTTVHAYTGDQNLVDGTHRDLRRARAAGLSIIPATTGAAKAIGLVLPELAGRLDGTSLRVPTPNVSMIDLCFVAERDLDRVDINAALEAAAAESPVMDISHEPLVSVDFLHSAASSTVDLTGTHAVGPRLGRVAAWYDNEWGFSCRMLDVARRIGAFDS